MAAVCGDAGGRRFVHGVARKLDRWRAALAAARDRRGVARGDIVLSPAR